MLRVQPTVRRYDASNFMHSSCSQLITNTWTVSQIHVCSGICQYQGKCVEHTLRFNASCFHFYTLALDLDTVHYRHGSSLDKHKLQLSCVFRSTVHSGILFSYSSVSSLWRVSPRILMEQEFAPGPALVWLGQNQHISDTIHSLCLQLPVTNLTKAFSLFKSE